MRYTYKELQDVLGIIRNWSWKDGKNPASFSSLALKHCLSEVHKNWNNRNEWMTLYKKDGVISSVDPLLRVSSGFKKITLLGVKECWKKTVKAHTKRIRRVKLTKDLWSAHIELTKFMNSHPDYYEPIKHQEVCKFLNNSIWCPNIIVNAGTYKDKDGKPIQLLLPFNSIIAVWQSEKMNPVGNFELLENLGIKFYAVPKSVSETLSQM